MSFFPLTHGRPSSCENLVAVVVTWWYVVVGAIVAAALDPCLCHYDYVNGDVPSDGGSGTSGQGCSCF